MNGNYERVTKSLRCPICQKHDWCLIARDRSAAICPRTPEGGKWLGEAGYLHQLGEKPPASFSTRPNVYTPPEADFDAAAMAERFQSIASDEDVAMPKFAAALGLTTKSLNLLGIGYSRMADAFAFPMKDHAERIVGIRLRNWEGRKWAVNGSRSGLFIGPKRPGSLFIGEGPTDTAALLDLDCWAIGRPSCRGGTVEIVRYIQRLRPQHVVVVSDCDGPGVAGAEDLADTVAGLRVADSVRVIEPLVGKDIRQWRIQGCTPSQLDQVVLNSAPWFRRAA